MDKRTYLKLSLQLLQNMKDMKFSRQVFFLIIIEKPYIGATPDGLIRCNCCRKGVLEVKGALCIKHYPLLQKSNENSTLKRNHVYFYQVQMQLYVYINYNVETLLCGLIKIYPLKELFQMKILWTA